MEILPQIAKELREIQVLYISSMIGWGCSWVAYSKIELDFQNIDPFSKSFLQGDGFKYFLFSPLFGEDFQFD